MTRRQIHNEVCQISRDWMLAACDPKDFQVLEVDKEPTVIEVEMLKSDLATYFEKVRQIYE
jgi:hypothetical protein